MKKTSKLLTKRIVFFLIFILTLLPITSTLADQNIEDGPIPDDTSERSLTIWKYQVKDISELGANGDGLAKTVDKTPLPGIKFSIEKVEPKEGAVLNDPTVDKEYDFVTDSEGKPVKSIVTSGDDGSVKHIFGTGKSADGVYLVTELPDDRPGDSPKVVQPVPPFFVNVPMTHRTEKDKLIYDIEVQPKNILESLIEPTKTIEESDAFSHKAGLMFDWEATANIPFGLYQIPKKDAVITPVYSRGGEQVDDLLVKKDVPYYADYLEFHDTLDSRLLLDDVVVQSGSLANPNSWTELEFNIDYKITLNGNDVEEQPVTSVTKNAKEVVVSVTQAGMEKLALNIVSAPQIRVVYTTRTDKDFSGVIANSFTFEYLTPGQKPLKKMTVQPNNLTNPDPVDPSYPKYYTGGFKVLKTNEAGNELEGAEFHLAVSKENSEKKLFLASDGNSYEYNSNLPSKVTFLKSKSEADGVAVFNGLPLAVSDTKENIKQSYWLVETKAPAGHELLNEPKEVEVNLTTSSGNPAITIINKSQTVLPFTGGQGTTLLIVFALGAIAIGTVAIVYDKKRQKI